MTKKTTKKTDLNFEMAINQLETILNTMEKNELGLEESLKEYETGMNLVRHCQKILTEAEHRIKLISEKNGVIQEEDFGEE